MIPGSLLELKRRLAETLVRSRLDYTDDILILNAFLRDFRWRDGASAQDLRGKWEVLLRADRMPQHFFSVYIHIPFCRKKCHFCYCSTEISTQQERIDGYVPELKREIDFFAPSFSGIPIRLFQVGGGTPNILTAAQLRDLLQHAVSSFSMEEEGMRIIEFNPSGAESQKLEAARKAGFNRISFGVQSLNAEVLERENREYQTYEMVRDSVAEARRLEFEVINVDLVLGLAAENIASFLEGFKKVAELRPTTIIVPGLTLTDAYLHVMRFSREENHRRYQEILPKALEGLNALCRQYGYKHDKLTPNRGIWVLYAEEVPRRVLDKISRGDHFAGGALSVLGLGHHARSQVFGAGEFVRQARAFSQDQPLYRFAPRSFRDEMIRYILYSIENYSGASWSDFYDRFGQDLRKHFTLELKALAGLGKIRLREEGFDFLPVAGPERIFYGMFFLLRPLSLSRFSNHRISDALLARVERELEMAVAEA